MLHSQRENLKVPTVQAHAVRKALYGACGLHGVALIFLFLMPVEHKEMPLVIDPEIFKGSVPVVVMPFVRRGVIIPKKIGVPGGSKNIKSVPTKNGMIRVDGKKKSAPKVSDKKTNLPVAGKKTETKESGAPVSGGDAPLKASVQKQEQPLKKNVQEKLPAPEEMPEGEPIQVGRDDLARFEDELAVQQEIARVWSVPPGIAKNVFCIVTVDIDASGKVIAVSLDTKSASPLFDASARMAALKAQYPKKRWGKKVRLQFGKSL